MKAVGFARGLPIDEPDSLIDFDAPKPLPGPRDLLVAVRAVSVNPVDTKVRTGRHQGTAPTAPSETPRVLGWDAAGVVVDTGKEVTGFAVGDEVFYAGALERPGTNAELHAVDFALVGRKPRSLDFGQAAALPLTSITAWELLFDRLAVPRDGGRGSAILVTGAAGGVGSILVQLARRLTALEVIATASRPDTVEWCRARGAHRVVDHTKPLAEQIQKLGNTPVRYIASLTATARNFPQLVEVLAPQGRIAVIDDPATLDVVPLKRKSASLHWEFMFARSTWRTDDLAEQGRLLGEVADLVDAGILQTTVTRTLSPINAANLREAHRIAESGSAIGKTTLVGF
jgi:zinc-binding alcohol dehydrogenase family protein